MSRRVLVFAPNWLGDAIMALPAVLDIRRGSPDCVVHVAARPSIAPLFPLVNGVETTITLGDRRVGVERIKAGGYERVVLLPNSFHAAWLAKRAAIPERWGYRTDFRAPLLTRAVTPPVRVHQAEYYQYLTTALGFAPGALEPALEIPPDRRAIGGDRLTAAGWDGGTPLVALAPGAAFGGAKRWPAKSFAATADSLARDGVRAVLIGSAADARAGAELESSVESSLRPINLIGQTDLPSLGGVLVHCRALVTNDSGAMHFAAAIGLRVIALFGPTNERETHAIGRAEPVTLHTDVWCRPCMLRECPLTHRCMRGITVDSVVHATRAAL